MGFFSMTAYFIVCDPLDRVLIMKSGLLAFHHICGFHTGEHLANTLLKIIKDVGIEQRVYFIMILEHATESLLFIGLAQLLQIMQAIMIQ